LRYFQQTFVASNPSLAPANVTPVRPNMRDLNTPELIIAATMTALIIGFGLYSHPLIDIVDSSVRGIANTIEHAKPVTSVTSAEENVH
jgi:NADH:ubiquinone oxidoreductase subunit 4 (subunit M)